MHTILVSKFDLRCSEKDGFRQRSFELKSPLRPSFLPQLVCLLFSARRSSLVFVSNPQFSDMLFCYLVRKLYAKRIKIVYFDLILRTPVSLSDRILCRIKRVLLAAVDRFLCIHRDTTGYELYFGVRKESCHYVPFKANNLDHVGRIAPRDGDYILALGVSQRDYLTLVKAVSGLDVTLKILVPLANTKKHNAIFPVDALPPNVEHISHFVDRDGWSKYIAESRFVVVPILPGVIQPAGISVYLEAMVLGKPVLVTEGASTGGILDGDLAVLVPPGDVDAMSRAIQRLWSDRELREKLRKNSLRYALALGGHERLVEDIRKFVGGVIRSGESLVRE